MTLRALAVALLLVGSITTAIAAPPPKDSEDWKVMHPYAEWVTTQHDEKGAWCCDIGDGRPVEAKIVDGPAEALIWAKEEADEHQHIDGPHWEVHVTPEHFPGETDRWMAVPERKIIRSVNPMGVPILWLYKGCVQCFAPPDGV